MGTTGVSRGPRGSSGTTGVPWGLKTVTDILYRSLSKIRPWAMNLESAQRGGWAYFRGPLSRK